MSHAYANNYLHCVFSTKDRAPSIPKDLQAKLRAYLKGIARNLDIPLIAVGARRTTFICYYDCLPRCRLPLRSKN
jgi:hypothetical protein